jgi:arginyl-tRNA--protein-N-Asp/Glu arginylyltransferase
MDYYSTDEIIAASKNTDAYASMYSQGYLLTRKQKGHMIQTRSLRVNLRNFELNSENRRILRKSESLSMSVEELPYKNYSWEIHKLGKEYYTKKFGDKVMSASKIKSMFTDMANENMTHVAIFANEGNAVGFALMYLSETIVHYAYPFYDLDSDLSNLGMSMMIRVVAWAKETGKEFVYLGSVTDENAFYKLQFLGLEWWENSSQSWSEDLNKLKKEVR